MVENSIARVAATANGTPQRVALALVVCAIAASTLASHLEFASVTRAAEVDAIGAPAPLGFADIIERVKPASRE
jgi:hypothetical protein